MSEKRFVPQEAYVHTPEVQHSPEIVIDRGALVLLIGPPASGKSTFAEKHFPVESVVTLDAVRAEITNNPSNQLASKAAFDLAKSIVESRLTQGNVAVVDAMNLDAQSRGTFTSMAKKLGVPVIGIRFTTDLQTRMARNLERSRQVDERFLKSREPKPHELDALLHDRAIDRMYEVTGVDDKTQIVLPEEDRMLLEQEEEFFQTTRRAGEDAFAFVEQQRERLKQEQLPRIEIAPGSIQLLIDSPAVRQFLENNTMVPQVIDIAFLAKRLGVSVDEEIVGLTLKRLLGRRSELGLVSYVLYTEETASSLHSLLASERSLNQSVHTIEASDEMLERAVVDVDRGVLPDERLLVLGDLHGALSTLQHMHKEVTQEMRANPDLPRRKMVFVGDIPDRGPQSARCLMYVAGLVRAGKADWILGNHDINLKKGLDAIAQAYAGSDKDWETWIREDFSEQLIRGAVGSRATRKSVMELLDTEEYGRPFVSQTSFEMLRQVLEDAPIYKEWRHLVAVHASMPREIQPDEQVSEQDAKRLTFGITKHYGPVKETLRLSDTTAKEPDRLLVGGHTHDPSLQMSASSGTIGLDVNGPTVYGMRYPELTFLSHADQSLVELAGLAERTELPTGQALLDLIDYLESQMMVRTKSGEPGLEYEGLTVVNYHEMTELKNLWDTYPVLRNFRGLIIDMDGTIVARPFKKTHKASVEIPIEQLLTRPEKVFEKANGSLGICYFWEGKWRMATKFSLHNKEYTVPAQRMLDQMNTQILNPSKTYLFEIILPEDPHIVDYHGEEALVLLNANDTKTGKDLEWEEVAEVAEALGTRTATDMTDRFTGMTIAEIYAKAQTPGELENLEGMMAIYTDQDTGERVTVKVKAVDYDNKKFIRDHFDWMKMLDAFQWDTLDIPVERRERFVSYQRDNAFVCGAFEARVQWIRDELARASERFVVEHATVFNEVQTVFEQAQNEFPDQAVQRAMDHAVQLTSKVRLDASVRTVLLGHIRARLGHQKDPLPAYLKGRIIARIDKEIQAKGKASYWLIPIDETPSSFKR